MCAIVEALALLDGAGEWLAEDHTSVAIRRGGVAVWLPEVVFVALPWDPVGGDDVHTLAVLMAGGELRRLAEYGVWAMERGFTHVVVCRGFRGADVRGLRKQEIGRWVRLLRVLG